MKSTTGVPSSAPVMYAVQIRAGNEPPVTVSSPPVPESDSGCPFALSFTIITAVDS